VRTYWMAALLLALLLGPSGVAPADEVLCPLPVDPQIGDSNSSDRQRVQKRFVGERFVRTELFFGSVRPGGQVTEAEFKRFLDQCVTPRFPDGLTVLMGALGQFRGADGVPVEERSMLVILLYPDDARHESSGKIEEIRDAYKQIFQQESVLRADRCCERVEF
jgi:Protein of unknown function (DUF3574)